MLRIKDTSTLHQKNDNLKRKTNAQQYDTAGHVLRPNHPATPHDPPHKKSVEIRIQHIISHSKARRTQITKAVCHNRRPNTTKPTPKRPLPEDEQRGCNAIVFRFPTPRERAVRQGGIWSTNNSLPG
ncbi:unnamed protein product [Ectocarpus sp. 6 AP-2014]